MILDYPSILVYRLRFVFIGIVLFAATAITLLLISATTKNINAEPTQPPQPNEFVMEMSDSPNVISNGLASVITGMNRISYVAKFSIKSDLNSFESAVTRNSRYFAQGISSSLSGITHVMGKTITITGRIVSSSFLVIGRIVGNSLLFIVKIPVKIFGFFANLPVVRSILRPSEFAEVPIIDPNSPELKTALAALPPAKPPTPTTPQQSSNPIWPIHGKVTTNFGVPHQPYQKTHTGMDISSGRASGVTPIKPFRSGKILSTAKSGGGLGNHVIIDHGNGVTSVYAHLASIAVQPGQEVTTSTTIGAEGTTGTSTGTHLHFEIRVNGQAANPRQFINGTP